MPNEHILVTGAAGQLGAPLTKALRRDFGAEAVIALDFHDPENPASLGDGPFQRIDTLVRDKLQSLIREKKITTVYHMAALKSNEAVHRPEATWNVNVNGLYNLLDILREQNGAKLIFPSSIAAYGPGGSDPSSLYGVSKRTCEMLCSFFRNQYNIDARSLRLPGVISPEFDIGGGGLTDFSTEIFVEAAGRRRYDCYLESDTEIELIHLTDAIKAMRALAGAPRENVNKSPTYAIHSFTASPGLFAEIIRKRIPEFELAFKIDTKRQDVANALMTDLDDSTARAHWGYQPLISLEDAANELLDQALKR